MPLLTRLILFLLTVSLPFVSQAQPDNTFAGTDIPVPPTAAGLGEYGDVPVGYFTGVPNISIPISVVKEGPLSLPISLSYHSAGASIPAKFTTTK